MLNNIPALTVEQFIKILEKGEVYCIAAKQNKAFYERRIGTKGIMDLIDVSPQEKSPAYVLHVLRQFEFTDEEIMSLFE
ncbi:MAG: type II toxin-antitoxin system HicA family toxin [Cyanobacteria bacterium P01_E01_bin.42]